MKRVFHFVLTATIIGSMTGLAFAADAPATAQATPTPVKPAASTVVPAKLPRGEKAVTAGSAIVDKSGDKQYPGVTIVPPRPPKKEALEATSALKAKAGQ
jgi:hypothetical protein